MADEQVKEKKMCLAEPAVLGLLGLGTAALVASSEKLELTDGTATLIPWVIVFGAIAQLFAAMTEFKKDNTFGATMFGVYGLYWLGLGMLWYLTPQVDILDQLGFVLIAMLVFTTFMLICAGAMNKAIFLTFLALEFMFAAMILSIFNGLDMRVAGAAEVFVAAMALYTSAAVMFESLAGKQILPFGKPIWKLKKVQL